MNTELLITIVVAVIIANVINQIIINPLISITSRRTSSGGSHRELCKSSSGFNSSKR